MSEYINSNGTYCPETAVSFGRTRKKLVLPVAYVYEVVGNAYKG